MRQFWKLYRKELRFLAGPGIGLIVLMIAVVLFRYIIHYVSPGIYQDNILMMPHNPPFIARYIVRPVIIGFFDAIEFLFAMLFLYAVLHEHFTRSRYQLFSIPSRRITHLTAKFGAVDTWAVAYIPILFIWEYILKLVDFMIPGFTDLPGRAAAELVVFSIGWEVTMTLSVCALAMLGYVVAVSVRRAPYLAGIATVIAGYVFMEWLSMVVGQFFHRIFPFQYGVPLLYQAGPWSEGVSQAIVAVIFIIPALYLYERFGEV